MPIDMVRKQRKLITENFVQILDEMYLTQDEARRVIKHENELAAKIEKLIEKFAHPSRRLAPELIPENCSIEEDSDPWENFEVANLEEFFLPKPYEKTVTGREWCNFAAEADAKLGLVEGKRILTEPQKIPVVLRGFWLPLSGTVLKEVLVGKLWVVGINVNQDGSCTPICQGLDDVWVQAKPTP